MAENTLFQQGFSEGFEDLFDEDKFKKTVYNNSITFWIF